MTPAAAGIEEAARSIGYLVAAAVSVGAARRELRRPSRVTWPVFWYVTAALFVAIALGRAFGVDDLVTDLGRNRARADGWYGARRGIQAVVAGTVAATWVIVVFFSIWRVPERRRPYLPPALAAFTIGCFGAGRLVSLHQLDTLLYRRSISGVRVVAFVEWTLLAMTIAATLWSLRETAARNVPDGAHTRSPQPTPSSRT